MSQHLQRLSSSPQALALANRKTPVIESGPKLYYPYDGDPSTYQSTETLAEFSQRLKPSTCSELMIGPWIWVHNPYVVPGSKNDGAGAMDREALMVSGKSLLNDFSAMKERVAKDNSGKAKGTITRKANVHLPKLREDLCEVAKNANCFTGKWMFFLSTSYVDNVWKTIAEAVLANKLGPTAKVATGEGNEGTRLICVYTRDFTDEKDVRRVLDMLVELDLVSNDGRGIYYKCDAYTYWDIGSGNEYGLKASMYSSNEMLKSSFIITKAKKTSGFNY